MTQAAITQPKFAEDPDDQIAYVVVARCNDAPPRVPGTTEGVCDVCEERVFVAPSTHTLVSADQTVRLVCYHCAQTFIPVLARLQPPTPAQLTEIAATLA
ncbi:MAG: hypothetical protein QN187_17940, partial [Armatimonadota bacterium]|nr:hypothetical protein [Armatimonadota bacterium]